MAKQWEGISGSETHFTADATSIFGSFQPTTPMTVMRLLGEYTISPTSSPAANDSVSIGVGVCVVSSDAFAVGASAVPEPFGDQAYPWLYWAVHPLHYPDTNADPAAQSGSVRAMIDVKSMRKLKGDRETLIWVGSYFNIAGNPPLSVVAGALRVLTAR